MRVNPGDIDGWSNLGYVYTDLQRLPEAIGAYREVVRINPEDVEGWSNLGVAYGARVIRSRRPKPSTPCGVWMRPRPRS